MKRQSHWLLAAAAIALLMMASTSADAQVIVYQDSYDNDGIEINGGIGGGVVSINTSPVSVEWAIGGWIDDGNLTFDPASTGWGGTSGGSYSMGAFTMPGGFKLEVTYNAQGSGDRFTMGLMEELGAEDRTAYGALATSGATTYEGIYFNAFAPDARYPNAEGLQLADGTAVVQLSDDQSRLTGVHTLVLEMDDESNWSYSVDDAPPTIGSIGGDGFDLNKSYRFITRHQPKRASQILAVTLTKILSFDPDLNGDLLVDDKDLQLLLSDYAGGEGLEGGPPYTEDQLEVMLEQYGVTPGNASAVPEPASLAIMGVGLGGLLMLRRRRI